MSLDDPVIITCAISGALTSRDRRPAIPYAPNTGVARARRMTQDAGRRPATAAVARAMLGVGP